MGFTPAVRQRIWQEIQNENKINYSYSQNHFYTGGPDYYYKMSFKCFIAKIKNEGLSLS